MKRILLIMMCIMLVGIASAESLGTFKQYEDVKLIQTCNNCSYCNFTLFDTSSAVLINNIETTKDGTLFYYDVDKGNLTILGDYKYCYNCGNTNEIATGCIDFNITPSGERDLLGLTIIFIVIVYAIGFIGFFGKNEWISIVGGLSMLVLGIYLINNGIDAYRNFMTLAFSYFTVALGVIFAFYPIFEMFKEM